MDVPFLYFIFRDSEQVLLWVNFIVSRTSLKHNRSHKGYTGKSNDWKLVYCEEFQAKESAIQRERQVKKWKSRKRVDELISRGKGSTHPD